MNTTTTMRVSGGARPWPLVWAVVLTVLTAIFSFATLPLIPDDAPSFVLPAVIGITIVSLIASWGLWQYSKWAAIVLFAITVLNGLAAAPGVFVDDVSAAFRVLSAVGLVEAVVVCWLLWLTWTRALLR